MTVATDIVNRHNVPEALAKINIHRTGKMEISGYTQFHVILRRTATELDTNLWEPPSLGTGPSNVGGRTHREHDFGNFVDGDPTDALEGNRGR